MRYETRQYQQHIKQFERKHKGKKVKGYNFKKLAIGILLILLTMLIVYMLATEPTVKADSEYYYWNDLTQCYNAK